MTTGGLSIPDHSMQHENWNACSKNVRGYCRNRTGGERWYQELFE